MSVPSKPCPGYMQCAGTLLLNGALTPFILYASHGPAALAVDPACAPVPACSLPTCIGTALVCRCGSASGAPILSMCSGRLKAALGLTAAFTSAVRSVFCSRSYAPGPGPVSGWSLPPAPLSRKTIAGMLVRDVTERPAKDDVYACEPAREAALLLSSHGSVSVYWLGPGDSALPASVTCAGRQKRKGRHGTGCYAWHDDERTLTIACCHTAHNACKVLITSLIHGTVWACEHYACLCA